jgi:hypothetical protein
MSKITLYHGSNAIFDTLNLTKSRDKRDFGRGFYTTSIKEQAEEWASSLYNRYGGAGKELYVLDLEQSNQLNVKEFDGLTREWLEMIKENRIRGGLRHEFDIVKGPVANDNTMPTIALYVDETLSLEATLVQLSYFKASNQISFHTERAIECLKIRERIEV